MNMVVAATLMLDGLPMEMLVDARGFLQEAAEWPALQRSLRQRADTLPGGLAYRSIGHSVVDHDAKQVAWHLARALEAMNFARSYLGFAKQTGPSTISWHGFPFDVNVARANAQGEVEITWIAPSRTSTKPDNQGRAVFRQDGFTKQLTKTSTPAGDSGTAAREIIEIEALPAS